MYCEIFKSEEGGRHLSPSSKIWIYASGVCISVIGTKHIKKNQWKRRANNFRWRTFEIYFIVEYFEISCRQMFSIVPLNYIFLILRKVCLLLGLCSDVYEFIIECRSIIALLLFIALNICCKRIAPVHQNEQVTHQITIV